VTDDQDRLTRRRARFCATAFLALGGLAVGAGALLPNPARGELPEDPCALYAEMFPDQLEAWIEGGLVCGDFAFPIAKSDPILQLTRLERAIALHGEDAVRRFIFEGGRGSGLPTVVPLPSSGALMSGALILLALAYAASLLRLVVMFLRAPR
jgi:hypothetical protein